ncbi:MAG: hypothetical protein HYV63_31305 [Candidatus Schekmanbacteria bacterium]|nr:hypothetical protein [Candidatus Schekmanbacteria bacterium]
MSLYGLSRRRAATLLFAVLFEGDRAKSLVELLPEREAAIVKEHVKRLLDVPKDRRPSVLLQEIRRLANPGSRAFLEEFHPSWIAHLLRSEPDMVRAAVLAVLPHLGGNGELPPPAVSVANLPAEICELIRGDFAGKFPTWLSELSTTSFDFDAIMGVSLSMRERLVTDVGMQHLAIALRGVEKADLARFLRRLSAPEQRDLLQVLRELTDISLPQVKAAQQSLLNMNLDSQAPDDIVWHVGLYQLAVSLSQSPAGYRLALAFRLPYRYGSRLLELGEQIPVPTGFDRATARNEFVSAFQRLLQRGAADKEWAAAKASFEAIPDPPKGDPAGAG